MEKIAHLSVSNHKLCSKLKDCKNPLLLAMHDGSPETEIPLVYPIDGASAPMDVHFYQSIGMDKIREAVGLAVKSRQIVADEIWFRGQRVWP